MRWVPISTLGDEALPNVMRKVIAHGLREKHPHIVRAR
jgi:A/G-specific adenine glycosylase